MGRASGFLGVLFDQVVLGHRFRDTVGDGEDCVRAEPGRVSILDAAEFGGTISAGVAPCFSAREIMRPRASEKAAAVPPGLPITIKHSRGPNSSSFMLT